MSILEIRNRIREINAECISLQKQALNGKNNALRKLVSLKCEVKELENLVDEKGGFVL